MSDLTKETLDKLKQDLKEYEVPEVDGNYLFFIEPSALKSSPRPRGRPKGSHDSYPRDRRYKKQPPPNAVAMLMPVIHELLDVANAQGYNKAFGVAPKRDQEAVDKSVAKLLATIKELLDARD